MIPEKPRVSKLLMKSAIAVCAAENFLSGKMGKKMQKANKVGAHYALILGGNEVINKTVTVKNFFATGEQKEIPREELKSFSFKI